MDCSSSIIGFPPGQFHCVLPICYGLTYSWLYAGSLTLNGAILRLRIGVSTPGFRGFRATVISSELLTELLAPVGDGLIEPMAQARLQALADAVPVALMEFRLQDGCCCWPPTPRPGACRGWARCGTRAWMHPRCSTC